MNGANNNNLGSIVDEEGNIIRPYDNNFNDQLIPDEGYQPLLNNQNSIHKSKINNHFSIDVAQRRVIEER
jgi:hypothetical protein